MHRISPSGRLEAFVRFGGMLKMMLVAAPTLHDMAWLAGNWQLIRGGRESMAKTGTHSRTAL